MGEKDFYRNLKKTKKSTLDEISNFEKENNAILSDSYKSFLLRTNGGKIKTYLLRSTIIDTYFSPASSDFDHYFGGICKGKISWEEDGDLYEWTDKNVFLKLGLWRLCYFLNPNYGLYICVSKENNGKIYITNDNYAKFEDGYKVIANDFDELLDSFVKFESDEELNEYYEKIDK